MNKIDLSKLERSEILGLMNTHNNSPTLAKYIEYSELNPFFKPMIDYGIKIMKEVVANTDGFEDNFVGIIRNFTSF